VVVQLVSFLPQDNFQFLHNMSWAPDMADFKPEPHTLLMQQEGTFTGIPAQIEDCLAMFMPCPPERTFPMMTSFDLIGLDISSSQGILQFDGTELLWREVLQTPSKFTYCCSCCRYDNHYSFNSPNNY
jgi:hypothetical protein